MPYTEIGWQDGTGPTLYPGLPTMDRGISEAHQGTIWASEYGALPNGSNVSTQMQNAIDAAFSGGFGKVVLDKGTYRFADVELKGGITLEGQGHGVTIVQPPAGSTATSVFKIGTGPVGYLNVKGMRVNNGSTSVTHGFYFNAVGQATSPFHGGLWYSGFEDLVVDNFPGSGFWFRGGTDDWLEPHQFLYMKNVYVFRASGTTSRALKCTGQVGQMTFDNCEFDGYSVGTGVNVQITREGQESASIVGFQAPYSFAFVGTTFQNAQYGIQTDSCSDINFYDPHFENMYGCIDSYSNSWGINVWGGAAGSATSDGAGNGFFMRSGTDCSLYGNGVVLGSVADQAGVSTGGRLRLENIQTGGSFTGNLSFSGMTLSLTAAATVSTYGYGIIALGTSATAVQTLNGPHTHGDRLTLISTGGSVQYATGGNLSLGGRTPPVTVPSGGVATFLRAETGSTLWHLVSVSV